jgi:site-specific recombinase XerD
MTEDMQMRNLAPRTQGCYVDCIAKFARFHGGSPSELGRGEVRDYLAYLAHERHASASYLRQTIAALRFVYRVTLDNADVVADIPWPKQPRRLPVVLSRQEVLGSPRSGSELPRAGLRTPVVISAVRIKS